MRLYVGLFAAMFLLQLTVYAIAAGTPVLDFLIMPAFLIGMDISGPRSSWAVWLLGGVAITAIVYALVLWLLWYVTSKLLRRLGIQNRDVA
jgi:hypothetical protein